MLRINPLLSKVGYRLVSVKQDAELEFWKNVLSLYKKWYLGELRELYGEPNPPDAQKIKAHTLQDSAILTWGKIHQEVKYLQDLALDKDVFNSMRLLDIGSGPHPSALVFENCEVYCLDPLLPEYINLGFPLHYYDRVKFIHARSEDVPVPEHFFDAVISVNALDHVDDFNKTAMEIQRILKPEGKIRFHLHYHKATTTEPIELNDRKILQSFNWCHNLKKISESKAKRGALITQGNEVYTLWSNF